MVKKINRHGCKIKVPRNSNSNSNSIKYDLCHNMINNNEDLTARQSRWGSLISDLEDEWDEEDDDNKNTIAPGLSSKGAGMGMGFEMASSASRAPAWGLSETSTTLIPAFIKPSRFSQWPGERGRGAAESSVCTHSLHNWITCRGRGGGDKKKYLEKSVKPKLASRRLEVEISSCVVESVAHFLLLFVVPFRPP